MRRWHVVETPCWPNAWKVKPVGQPGGNHTYWFFRSKADAEAEARRRNAATQDAP